LTARAEKDYLRDESTERFSDEGYMEEPKDYPKKRKDQLTAEADSQTDTEKYIHETKERHRFLVENMNEGVAIIQDRHIKFVNSQLTAISGYSAEELIDTPFGIYIHPVELPKVVDIYMRRIAGENAPARYELRIKNKNGRYRSVEAKASLITYQGKPADLVILRDITEQKQEKEIQSSLDNIPKILRSTGNLDKLYQSIHGLVSVLVSEGRNFYIALWNEDSKTFHFPYFVDEHQEKPGPQELGKGLTDYVLQTGEPLLASPEIISRLNKKGDIETAQHPNFVWLGVPLKRGGKTIGVMAVQSYNSGVRYSEEDKNILLYVSGLVAFKVEQDQDEKGILEIGE